MSVCVLVEVEWWAMLPPSVTFSHELVPADRVWSPPHATLDNQKGNILEPFPLELLCLHSSSVDNAL